MFFIISKGLSIKQITQFFGRWEPDFKLKMELEFEIKVEIEFEFQTEFQWEFETEIEIENKIEFVLVIAWFRVQLTINLTSGN